MSCNLVEKLSRNSWSGLGFEYFDRLSILAACRYFRNLLGDIELQSVDDLGRSLLISTRDVETSCFQGCLEDIAEHRAVIWFL